MRYRVTHQTRYAYSEAVPLCHNQVHLVPRRTARQSCRWHDLSIRPLPAYLTHHTDAFGNRVDHFSLEEAHRGLTVTSRFEVTIDPLPEFDLADTPRWEDLAQHIRQRREPAWLDALAFVYPSPGVSWERPVEEFARASFPANRPVGEAVAALTAAIHREFRYDPEATTVDSPVDAVFQARAGVCQDFAHVGVAALRSLGLPARYVSGYLRTVPPPGQPPLVGVDQSHAWFSVFLGELGWVDFDPTNDLVCDTDHITVAWGRDYGDICPIQGVFIGGGQHAMTVDVSVIPLDPHRSPASAVTTG